MRPEERELVAHVLRLNVEPVRKISIVSRAGAGGYTRVAGDDDRRFWNEARFRAQIAFTMGELAAEEVLYGARSTGAAGDLQQANELARAMVYRYGMSPKLGPVVVDVDAGVPVSPALLDLAKNEVRSIVETGLVQASALIERRRPALDQLVKSLLAQDSLDGRELKGVLTAVPPLAPDEAVGSPTISDVRIQTPPSGGR